MKNKLYIIIVLFNCLLYSQTSMHSEIIYKKKGNLSGIGEGNENNEAKKVLALSYAKMEDIEYKLIFNNTESIFREIIKMENEDDSGSLSLNISRMLGFGTGDFYINLKEDKISHQKTLTDDLFLINYSIKDLNWELKNESKKIGGYNCYKAISKYKLETVNGTVDKLAVAWYSVEIPYQFGPGNYVGLPGLIIELEIGKVIYYATKISLNIKEKANIKPFKKGINVSKKEYDEIVKNGFDSYKGF